MPEVIYLPENLLPPPPPPRTWLQVGLGLTRYALIGGGFILVSGLGVFPPSAFLLKSKLVGGPVVSKTFAWLTGKSVAARAMHGVLTVSGAITTGMVVEIMVEGTCLAFYLCAEMVQRIIQSFLGRPIEPMEMIELVVQILLAAGITVTAGGAAQYLVVLGPAPVGAGFVAYIVAKSAWDLFTASRPQWEAVWSLIRTPPPPPVVFQQVKVEALVANLYENKIDIVLG